MVRLKANDHDEVWMNRLGNGDVIIGIFKDGVASSVKLSKAQYSHLLGKAVKEATLW